MIAIAGLTASMLGGCASIKLSNSQKASIQTVSVSEATMADEAYQEPNARKSTNAANAGGMAGGFIGSLVGSAIDASVMASQQKRFRDEYGETFDSIEEMLPQNLSERIQGVLAETVQHDEFFAEKMTEVGQSKFESKVVAYGLRRTETASSDNMLMQFFITVEIRLENRGSEKLFTNLITGISPDGYLLTEYVDDSALFEDAVSQSVSSLGTALGSLLDLKLGRES